MNEGTRNRNRAKKKKYYDRPMMSGTDSSQKGAPQEERRVSIRGDQRRQSWMEGTGRDGNLREEIERRENRT